MLFRSAKRGSAGPGRQNADAGRLFPAPFSGRGTPESGRCRRDKDINSFVQGNMKLAISDRWNTLLNIKICKRLHTFRKLRLYALSYKQQIQTKRVLHSHSKPFLLDRFLGRLFLLRLPIQYTRRRLSTYGQLRYICVPAENIALAVASNIIRLK